MAIGDSAVAPKFNVVCKPNGWSKDANEGARILDIKPPSRSGQITLKYWTALRDYLRDNKSFLRSQKPSASNWTAYALGRAYFNLTAIISIRSKRVTASIVMLGHPAKHFFRELSLQKDDISRDIGESLSWEERPEGVESRIAIHQAADPADESDWPRQQAWLRQKLEKLHRAFAPRIRSLPPFPEASDDDLDIALPSISDLA